MTTPLEHIEAVCADVKRAVKEISVHGKGQRIKTNKPKDGVYAFVWRMARFHSGQDPRMPVCADWDLSAGIKAATGEDMKFYVVRAGSVEKQIMDKLDKLVDACLIEMKIDRFGGARVWAKALGANFFG